MKRVVVASANPVKIEAVRGGFERMFPGEVFRFENVSVPSGVSSQPLTHAETLLGAQNRARRAALELPGADYYLGVEGGVEEIDARLSAFAWVFVHSGSPDGPQSGEACTASFYLPPAVAELVRQGLELGEADDRIFGRVNSKQENGAVGILTENVIDRARLYEQAVILALIPFKNPALY